VRQHLSVRFEPERDYQSVRLGPTGPRSIQESFWQHSWRPSGYGGELEPQQSHSPVRALYARSRHSHFCCPQWPSAYSHRH
jgi:hypothetical protein